MPVEKEAAPALRSGGGIEAARDDVSWTEMISKSGAGTLDMGESNGGPTWSSAPSSSALMTLRI